MYVDRCGKEIIEKISKCDKHHHENHHHHTEDISTRGFLSHKRTSGQGIVSTIYQVLPSLSLHNKLV